MNTMLGCTPPPISARGVLCGWWPEKSLKTWAYPNGEPLGESLIPIYPCLVEGRDDTGKAVQAWFNMTWIVMALILWGSCLQATTSAPPDQVIRQALTKRLMAGMASASLQENPMTSAHVRAIVHDHLAPSLLTAVLQTIGTDFRFVQSGQQTETHVALLILSYPDEKTTLRMTKKLASRGGYFKRTKILTRFSRVAVGSQLVIAFTENAGNEDMVKFIHEFPELFQAVP